MIKTTAKPWGNLEAPLGHISIVLSLAPVLAETPGYNFPSAVGTLHLAYILEETVVVNKSIFRNVYIRAYGSVHVSLKSSISVFG